MIEVVKPSSERPRLKAVVKELAAVYGVVAPPELTPLELILLENASYLVDDDRRWQVFERLRAQIGVTPEAIQAGWTSFSSKVRRCAWDRAFRELQHQPGPGVGPRLVCL